MKIFHLVLLITLLGAYTFAQAQTSNQTNKSPSSGGPTLTLDAYKQIVLEKDPETQAAMERKKGAELSQNSASLLTNVSLFAKSDYVDDQRPTAAPLFQGDTTRVDTYSLGLQQQTRLGFKWALSQNVSHTQIYGVDPNVVPQSKYYDTYPKLELSIPLWRNLLGAETSGDVDQMHFQARALAKQAEIGWVQRQNDVEAAFYRVLSEQDAYSIHQDSLKRAEGILNWTDTRVKRNLVDASDLYQAQAAVAQRKIDVIDSETRLRDASRVFNSLRGVAGDEVAETLVAPDLDLMKLKLQKSAALIRKDTLAQKELNLSSEAGYKSQREKNKPNLDVAVQAYTQGRDNTYTGSQDKTFEKKDYFYVGVNFVLPLDQWTASKSRSGFESLTKAEALSEQARLRDQPLTWEQTVDQADSLSKQVVLLRELETYQRKKADAERDRLNRGRSTTFQVLSFEQDYNMIRTQRIDAEFQARQFINSLALYE
jgi:outer membrane protein TolC